MPTTTISYKVTGKVQGVFFRKYTKKKADLLNLQGWVKNTTDKQSVVGEATGNTAQVKLFENYLKSEGSPKSRIDKTVIKEIEKMEEYPELMNGFVIVR